MKNRLLYIGLSVISALVLSSCKNDLDVLAPGEESVSVYGILNPNEPVQKIRINKVYLSDGDVLAAGKDNATINYGPGELQVTLQRFLTGSSTPTLTTVNNNFKKEIVLTETVVTTADGAFNTEQRIWQTTDRLYKTGQYKLLIKNISTGKEYSSESIVIDSVKTLSSNSIAPFLYNPLSPTQYPMHGYYPASPLSTDKPKYVNYEFPSITYSITFNSVVNAKMHHVTMRFHYNDISLSNDTTPQYVDYNFPTVTTNIIGGEKQVVTFEGQAFYENLANGVSKIPAPNLKHRRVDYIEYIISAGAESLNTFLQVNQPSNSIAQDKPYYSNINGGVGIFSSRSVSIVTKDLWNDFIDKIACHPSTNPYNFCNSSGALSTVCP